MNSIAKTVVTGLVGAGVGIAAITGIAVAVSDQGPDATAEFYGGEYAMDEAGMTQEAFPCEEDSVLMYAPQFGPDHVGCVNIEDLS